MVLACWYLECVLEENAAREISACSLKVAGKHPSILVSLDPILVMRVRFLLEGWNNSLILFRFDD